MDRRPIFRAMCLLFGLFALPASAAAQEGAGVVIMKFERLDASDRVVQALDASLNDGIEAHPDMYVKRGGDATISDMAIAAGCAKPDEACLKTLRDFVDADRVVFGSVQASDAVHLFTMRMFDFAEGRFIAEVADQTIEGPSDRVVEILPAVVESFLYGDVGTLTVSVTGADAPDLIFDGAKIGLAPTTVENLPLGEHVVTLRTSDGAEQSQTVVLRHNAPVSLDFAFYGQNTKKPEASGPSAVPGIVSITVGVLGVGLGVFSSLQVADAEADNQRLADDGFVDPASGAFTSADAAAQARAAGLDPTEIDDRGKLYQNLQWVGYGVGAVGIGLGVFLLSRAMGGGEKETQATLPFDFGVAPTRGGIATSLRLRF